MEPAIAKNATAQPIVKDLLTVDELVEWLCSQFENGYYSRRQFTAKIIKYAHEVRESVLDNETLLVRGLESELKEAHRLIHFAQPFYQRYAPDKYGKEPNPNMKKMLEISKRYEQEEPQ